MYGGASFIAMETSLNYGKWFYQSFITSEGAIDGMDFHILRNVVTPE